MIRPILISVCALGLPLLTLLTSCQPSPEQILPRQEGEWRVSRLIYEYILVSDQIESLDTLNYALMTFSEGGSAQISRFDNDTLSLGAASWAVPESDKVSFEFDRIDFRGQREFLFQVLESKRDAQLWRAENVLTVYDPLRRDSVEARVLLQMDLDREGE